MSARRNFERACAGALAVVARVLAGTEVRGASAALSAQQCIFFANHASHLDFVVLWSALPSSVRERTRPIAASDYWQSSRLRRFLAERVFRAVLVERQGACGSSAAANAAAMRQALAEGSSLILFPEGTSSADTTVGEFRSGLYYLARQWPGVQMVPVRLENMGRILPRDDVFPVPLIGRLTFGRAIQVWEDESKPHFLERARNAVVQMETTRCA
ncbi:MAG TPA: lysophospholipid acyltransferase family protein [Acidobacteriaceae bacterium]|jgi:1-acyl-sn-glycerol-3-phosphate acyltransferase